MRKRTLCVSAAVAVGALVVAGGAAFAGNAKPTVVVYDDFSSAAASAAKWGMPYGPGEAASPDNNHFLKITNNTEEMKALPFRTGYDFSVYDHLKLMETSTTSFPVPASGSIAFSADISASTPGTVKNLVQLGAIGWSWLDPADPPYTPNYSAPLFEGQQAGVVLNMIDFCTGQLFDWFLSGNQAFTLIERLPTSVTNNSTNTACPAGTNNVVGPGLMYTQIANVVPISSGRHNVSIRYTPGTTGTVEYFLDGKLVSKIGHVGVPLDRQGVNWTGTYPSATDGSGGSAPGEELGTKISSFTIGHGLFSLLDAFPFQYPGAQPNVSIPVGAGNPADAGRARLFGQGADGVFDNITVTTTNG